MMYITTTRRESEKKKTLGRGSRDSSLLEQKASSARSEKSAWELTSGHDDSTSRRARRYARARRARSSVPTLAMSPDVSEASSSATLTLPDGRVLELPVLRDAAGATFLDVRRLYPEHAVCTFDPGFNSTACASAITYIDGENGRLLYRGYPIEELAKHGDMMDCWHLLLRGTLPTRAQRRVFQREARGHRMVHEHLIRFFNGFQHDAHPMAIMVSVVGALSAFYDKDHGLDYDDAETRDVAGLRVVGKMTTLAAMAYKTAHGQPIVYPRDDLNLAENFMYMLFALPTRAYEVDPVAAKCLEVILMLHADHEQNASTSTVRIAGSSKPTPSRASPRAWRVCGVPRTEARTKLCWRCSRRSGRWRTYRRRRASEG